MRSRCSITRLIPAGAGSTTDPGPRTCHPRAHPRWRGEHFGAAGLLQAATGSSPLARGAPGQDESTKPPTRLIPAGAGSTGVCRGMSSSVRAHPRWRGEHFEKPRDLQDFKGSSPLARGALPIQGLELATLGLIPAGAGSTQGRTGTPSRPWAHPRWRGEHRTTSRRSSASRGSSPLARGAHLTSLHLSLQQRLIPAGAGSTVGEAWKQLDGGAHPRWRGEH